MKRLLPFLVLFCLWSASAWAVSSTPTSTATQTEQPTAFATPSSIVCANAIGCTQVVTVNAAPHTVTQTSTKACTQQVGYAPTGSGCSPFTVISTAVGTVSSGNKDTTGIDPTQIPAGSDICIKTTCPISGSVQ